MNLTRLCDGAHHVAVTHQCVLGPEDEGQGEEKEEEEKLEEEENSRESVLTDSVQVFPW